jgi:hypothetical protein
MTRKQALPYVSFCIDDALSVRELKDMPTNARLVGWQCGFEPLFVAVWSYLDVTLGEDEAMEIATDYLLERNWFSDPQNTDPDYVI